MKNLFYFSIIVCAVIAIISCGNKKGATPGYNPDITPEEDATLTTEDTISLGTFNTWVSNWDSLGLATMQDSLTRYFTMPLIDITEFDSLRSSNIVAARFHLGLELDGTDRIPHLMLTGVNSRGEDVIGGDQYIYDVTLPCPSLCGKESVPK